VLVVDMSPLIIRNISFRACGFMRKYKVAKHDDVRADFTLAFE
jgi:hypothetical protein